MKILVQVVDRASVVIEDKEVSSIGKGYLILVSFNNEDTYEIIDRMVEKLCKTRLFLDENGKTNLSIFDVDGEILSVSQFTLYGSLRKTNRPSFVNSCKYELAETYYNYFNDKLKEKISTKCGVFGADMKIELVNNGPFTMMIDSDEVF